MSTAQRLAIWFVATTGTFLALWKFQFLSFPDTLDVPGAIIRCCGCALVYLCVTLFGRATYHDYVTMSLGYQPHPLRTILGLGLIGAIGFALTAAIIPGYQLTSHQPWFPVLVGIVLFLPYAISPDFGELPRRD